MQLFDAFFALILTIAGLATVVTASIEVGFRFLALRGKHLQKLVHRIGSEVVAPALGMDPERDRGLVEKFIVNIVENPGLPFTEEQKKKVVDPKEGSPYRAYESVSVEHVLRRLAELEPVEALLARGTEEAEALLDRTARKFAEFGSAASTRFRRNARMWSLVTGIVVALVLNADGVRILEAFRNDPKLTATVIENSDDLLAEASKAIDQAKVGKDAQAGSVRLGERTGESATTASGPASSSKNAQDPIALLEKRIASVQAAAATLPGLGVPLGNEYYPHCGISLKLGALTEEDLDLSPDPLCRVWVPDEDAHKEPWGWHFFRWLVSVLVTGLLIGLGGPFWFDLAQRVASIRQAFHGKPPPEQALSGQDLDSGDAQAASARARLVQEVVADARKDADLPAQDPTRSPGVG